MMINFTDQPEIDRAQSCHISRIFIVEMAVGNLNIGVDHIKPRQIGGNKRMNRRLGFRRRQSDRRRNFIRAYIRL